VRELQVNDSGVAPRRARNSNRVQGLKPLATIVPSLRDFCAMGDNGQTPGRPLSAGGVVAARQPLPTFISRLRTFALGFLLAGSVPAFAAAPVLEHLYPAGANPGTTALVTASGKFESWPVEAWVEGGGLTFQARTNSGKFDVVIAPDAAPGPRLVRLFHPDGASEPRLFVVGTGTDLSEVEPNDRFRVPQVVTNLPSVMNGRLDKNGDVDSFAVSVKAGQWLEARLDAFTLMSKIDPVLRLVNTNGEEVAWNHDFITFDPRIARRSTQDETLVVQVFGFRYPAESSVSLAGGEGSVYRLHLTAGDREPQLFPGGARESEPNDTVAASGALPSEGVLCGELSSGADEDRFRFHASKDAFVTVDVEAALWGSPLDAWVRVEDLDGKELAFNDDGEASRDPHLDWKAPRDGEFVVVVGSRTHRGGSEHRYRLNLRRGEPTVSARLVASSVLVNAGATNEVKVTVNRRFGATNAVQCVIRDLPQGVTAAAVDGPAGDGESVLKLVATTGAKAFNGPVRVVLEERGTGRESIVPQDLVSRGENNGVPQGWSRLLKERTDWLWLTVKPAK
jgi:hypothetical protein